MSSVNEKFKLVLTVLSVGLQQVNDDMITEQCQKVFSVQGNFQIALPYRTNVASYTYGYSMKIVLFTFSTIVCLQN